MKNDSEKFTEGTAVPNGHYAAEAVGREPGLANLDASCRETGRELERLNVWQQAQQRALKSRFNVFTTVLKFDDEVRLHSRWLHYLLNPDAEHDCGTLFLDLFIQTLRQRGAQPHEDEQKLDQMDELETFASDAAKVERELHTTDGNIDIHIGSPTWLIVVENKTKSGEGVNQIRDYAKYCVEHCRDSGQKFKLLFLTPDGRKAQSAGEYKDRYRRISYRDHILRWLEECLRATYPFVHINQALQQYRNVVNQLLNRSSDRAYMNAVIEILKKHKAIIEHVRDIDEAVEMLRQSYWKDFVRELRKQLGERGITLGQENVDDKDGPYFWFEGSTGFRRNNLAGLKTTLQYCEHSLCLGECVYPPDEENRQEFWAKKREAFAPVINRLASQFSGAYERKGNNAWPLGWAVFRRGFMLPAFLAENATQHSRPLLEQVADFVMDILRYLKALEEASAQAPAQPEIGTTSQPTASSAE